MVQRRDIGRFAAGLLPPVFFVSNRKHDYGHNSLCVCVRSAAKSCPTLCNPIDNSPPGSCVHGIIQAKYWNGLPFPSQGIFWTKGSNPHLLCLLHWHVGSLPLGGLTIHWIILILLVLASIGICHPALSLYYLTITVFPFLKRQQQFCEQRRQNWLTGEIY